MKELVLTHLIYGSGHATIALVDYDAYTVSVKNVPVESPSLETGILADLIKAGKLRYDKNVTVKGYYDKDCWLAFDPVRGCLVVTASGEVKCVSAYDLLGQLGRSSSRHVCVPKRFGTTPTSFYSELKAIEKRLNVKFPHKAVLEELSNIFGIYITYTDASTSSYGKQETYSIYLYGSNIDRLDIEGTSNNIYINLYDGSIGDLWLDVSNYAVLNMVSDYSSIERLHVSHRLRCLEFKYVESDGVECPELIPESTACALRLLKGYKRARADLSVFKQLHEFQECWSYRKRRDEKAPITNLIPIAIKLPKMSQPVFQDSFVGVDIHTLSPYKIDNELDITGLGDIINSFNDFTGVNFIRGYCNGRIKASFISNEFGGKFEITASYVEQSFGYHSKRKYGWDRSNGDEFKPKYAVEGHVTIIYPKSVNDDKYTNSYHATFRDSNCVVGDVSSKLSITLWKQTQLIRFAGSSPLNELVIHLHETVQYIVDVEVSLCKVFGGNRGYSRVSKPPVLRPIFNKTVQRLLYGDYPYDNVRSYGEKCFSNTSFGKTYLCVLPEGPLQDIGTRAFYKAHGIEYLVIPRSCSSIGTAAFSETLSYTGDLTTICVYRDSYGHLWSKGKKLKIKVIDSLEDIPKEASIHTESDFIAAFVDTPPWAIKSKAFVAKVLTMSEIDLLARIPVVATLTPDLIEFFQTRYNEIKAELQAKVDEGSAATNPLLVSKHSGVPCEDGNLSRAAVVAAALHNVFGSALELLDLGLFETYKWNVRQAYDIKIWTGTPRVRALYSGGSDIHVYLRGDEILYIGCGSSRELLPYAKNTEVLTPRYVPSSEILFGPEIEGRLSVSSGLGASSFFTLRVHGEDCIGDVAMKMKALLQSMVFLGYDDYVTSGKVTVKTALLYDLGTNRIHKFTSSERSSLGVYQGDLSLEEYREDLFIKIREQECLIEPETLVKEAEIAPPSFELEFCRKKSKFNLRGPNPRIDLFVELLTKSGLIKRVTKSVIDKRLVLQHTTRLLLADGTQLYTSPSPSGYTYLLGLSRPDGKFHGFEAGFDMLTFIETVDERVLRGVAYPKRKTYLTLVDKNNLFPVTPTKSRWDDNYDRNHQQGLYLALDFVSGKLVLAYSDTYDTSVICAFASAKDAREFYTEFKCKFFALPDKYFKKSLVDTIYVRTRDDQRFVDFHPYQSDARFANALAAIGNHTHLSGYNKDKDIYNETILKYCKL